MVLSCFAGIVFTLQNVHVVNLTQIGLLVDSGLFKVDWALSIDNLSLSIGLIVLIISTIVHIYSTDYMDGDPHITRFMSYLSLFTFCMLILVTAENFIVMFLGWEGVGLCSYLLIGFWFTRINAVKSATKAIIVNRVGDLGLTVAMCLTFWLFQSTDFALISALVSSFTEANFSIRIYDVFLIDAIVLGLCIGAMAKSAQIGLHTWLPDAMEGPTPVSSLLHSSTMVCAGVFLCVRASALLENSPDLLFVISTIGALTCFFAATSGLVQSDIKKVIAYSTCSQLGYMFFVAGLSGYRITMFHLSNHAFFKAMLFLTAGIIIHSVANEQDMRRFGGLLNILPVTYMFLFIGSLSLMGFPFLTGYYSKDLIIEYAFGKYADNGSTSALLGIITAGITSFYSLRLIFLTFLTTGTNVFRTALIKAHELSNKLLFALTPLVLGSIFVGYLTKDLFVGVGSNFWNNSITILPQNNTLVEAEFTPLYIKFTPFIVSMFAILPLVVSYIFLDSSSIFGRFKYARKLYKFLTYKWYFDAVYNRTVVAKTLRAAYLSVFKAIDKGLIEQFGPTSTSALINDIARYTVRSQSGYAPKYAMYLVELLGILLVAFIIYTQVVASN